MANDDRRLTELLDREAIRDCLFRYCRGVDRGDEAALRSAYWPDAVDNHGRYSGPVEGFFQWAMSGIRPESRNIHQVSNVLIEFNDDSTAVAESYFHALQRSVGKTSVRQVLLAGRYCDLFRKRDGEWRIAERVVAFDWVEEQTPPDDSEEVRFGPRKPVGTLYPNDPIYEIRRRAGLASA